MEWYESIIETKEKEGGKCDLVLSLDQYDSNFVVLFIDLFSPSFS